MQVEKVAQWLEPRAGVRARTVVQTEREREREGLISMLMISKALLISFVSSGMTSADNRHFPKGSTVVEHKEKTWDFGYVSVFESYTTNLKIQLFFNP